ncbi:hypothetical protein PUN28_010746 [Cardiocondyla obscurior]|uniref:Uncharacterized protein n=1 Tax=Cardiocondyla obscurior TaxID=286306 RepID=A0AAW2FJK9_9HYME
MYSLLRFTILLDLKSAFPSVFRISRNDKSFRRANYSHIFGPPGRRCENNRNSSTLSRRGETNLDYNTLLRDNAGSRANFKLRCKTSAVFKIEPPRNLPPARTIINSRRALNAGNIKYPPARRHFSICPAIVSLSVPQVSFALFRTRLFFQSAATSPIVHGRRRMKRGTEKERKDKGGIGARALLRSFRLNSAPVESVFAFYIAEFDTRHRYFIIYLCVCICMRERERQVTLSLSFSLFLSRNARANAFAQRAPILKTDFRIINLER